jgi:hypothetical protein
VNVYVAGRKLRLDPASSIGKGGEADVFDVGGGRALKLFKAPDHPDLAGDPGQQEAARQRIAEHQEKLRRFPSGLPDRIVRPEKLVTTKDGGLVLGYTMRLLTGAEVLLRYGERSFRQGGVGGDAVVTIFRGLHETVVGLHRCGVVIGDFNDLNVLVLGDECHLIDADSFQFDGFVCRVFTERFVDPLHCDPAAPRPLLVRPHDTGSDWYAYAVMLMRSLLFVDPYGGVFKPGPASVRVSPAARPLHRITVFHPEVRYPKPALHWDVLPDDLLQLFHCVFEKDRRGVFPLRLLDDVRWTRCTICGNEHARRVCPFCSAAAPAAVREVTMVRGDVRATRLFRTRGHILWAGVDSAGLRLIVHEDGAVKREDGATVLTGDPQPRMRFGVCGRRTLVARDGTLVTLAAGQAPESRGVDTLGSLPLFATSERHVYWVEGGRLLREGRLGPERIGDVLPGQTLFWVGPEFGFGFYRAGDLHVSFVFEAEGRGLNDGVRVPPLRGQLVDAACVFGKNRCWLLTTTRDAGRTLNRCVAVRRDGTIDAAAEAEAADGSWLSEIHGTCAAGGFLLAATDDGIVRVEVEGGRIVKTREFPDTEPFVDAGCRLLAGKDGLYVVDRQEVRLLRLG